ncbi:acyl-CoA N-acyltransferase [Karstenula rhodostoma CBS 690.94]|uniref:Acyl-CoA N-acyltransferase n=1 Tax=Karstenula rhodostoma CBS 690.94 TaxID=1392251 RepID=A0A9P4P6Y0_9PLEO|nr:acyl-CoA N-acyltransferase [Karstenula rhodostoma CBS 690.94]
MPPRNHLAIAIHPLQYADIHACARITAAAFSTDRHTIVKQLGGKPFDMCDVSRDGFLATLHKKNYIYVKAVDSAGNIVGHAGWGFRGVEETKIASEGPADSLEDCEKDVEKRGGDDLSEGRLESKTHGEKAENGIDRLHALEDADMQHAMASLMPPSTSCMYIAGLIVSPAHHSKGVGSALIEFGNANADRLGVFTWVHSSDQAWRAYAKFGFEVVRELHVDLDDYAPSPPRKGWAERLNGTGEGVTEDRWGKYTIRYMKRLPKAASR